MLNLVCFLCFFVLFIVVKTDSKLTLLHLSAQCIWDDLQYLFFQIVLSQNFCDKYHFVEYTF